MSKMKSKTNQILYCDTPPSIKTAEASEKWDQFLDPQHFFLWFISFPETLIGIFCSRKGNIGPTFRIRKQKLFYDPRVPQDCFADNLQFLVASDNVALNLGYTNICCRIPGFQETFLWAVCSSKWGCGTKFRLRNISCFICANIYLGKYLSVQIFISANIYLCKYLSVQILLWDSRIPGNFSGAVASGDVAPNLVSAISALSFSPLPSFSQWLHLFYLCHRPL